MAKVRKASKAVLNWKRKKWYEINAPSFFNSKVLGKTPAFEPEMLIGRQIESNLMMLTRDPKKQNIKVKFEVTNINGVKCETRITKYEIMSNSMKKYVRRDKSKIDDSFLANTKDNIQIRIKPLIVTQFNSSKAIMSELRKKAKEFVTEKVASNTYDNLIQDIIVSKFQKEMKDNLKKITSVKTSEIRIVNIEQSKKQYNLNKNVETSQVENTATVNE